MTDTRPNWKFNEDSIFREAKLQVVREIEETMKLVGMTRHVLAGHLEVNPSALTQSLDINRGIQLATLVRIANVLGCEVEINFIKRPPFVIAVAEEIEPKFEYM